MKHKIRGFVCLVAAVAALGAWAEVKWSYEGTALTQLNVTEGGKAWVFKLTTAGALSITTTGSSDAVLDFRSEAMPPEAPAIKNTVTFAAARVVYFPPNINPSATSKSSKTLEEVYLGEGSTAIIANIFNGCTALKKAVIPASVTSIGASAFQGCTVLENVTIPAGVTSIGEAAFRECKALTDMTVPGGVKTVPRTLFYQCTALTNVTFSDGIVDMSADSVCKGCSALESVYLSKDLTNLGAESFRTCAKLKSISIPNCVTNIGNNAFDGCSSLKTAVLPEKLAYLGEYAFNGCSALESVTPMQFNDLVYIGRSSLRGWTAYAGGIAFGYATNALTGEMIETEIHSQDGMQLRDSPKLAFVRFGPGVKSIPAGGTTSSAGFFYNASPALCEFGCNLSDNFPRLYVYASKPVLTNVIFRATGDITLSKMMLRDQTKLSEITWDGFLADYAYTTSTSTKEGSFYGWQDLQCRFLVPINNIKWKQWCASADNVIPWDSAEISQADRDKYFTRYGADAQVPFGVTKAVTGGLPRTYIVKTGTEIKTYSLAVSSTLPDEYATITLNPAPSAEGYYDQPTEVEVTVNLLSGTTFRRWEGMDLPEEDVGKPKITVMVDGDLILKAVVSASSFIVQNDPTGRREIYDGEQEILVSGGLSALTLGQVISHRPDGVLDLDKPVQGGALGLIAGYWSGLDGGAAKSWLTEVRMSDSVTNIGDHAFAECAALKTAVLSEKLVRLDEYAFYKCSALESLTPTQFNDLVYIGRSALRECSSLETGIAVGFATNAVTGEMIETVFQFYESGIQFSNSPKLPFVRLGPGVKSLPADCFNGNSPALCEFGCNLSNNFPRLHVYNNKPTLTNVIFRATGDITLSTASMLRLQTKLSEITWDGFLAGYVVSTGTDATFSGWNDLQCRFLVPASNVKWLMWCANADNVTPWDSAEISQADRDKYFARYGADAQVPFGITKAVTGGLPRTYIVKTGPEAEICMLNTSTTLPDFATITLDPAPGADGLYPEPTEVEVTANVADGATFGRWEGDVPPGAEKSATIRVLVDGVLSLKAVVVADAFIYQIDQVGRPEIYDGDQEILVSGNLSALTLGQVISHRPDGVLDLDKPVQGGALGLIVANWSGLDGGAAKSWLTAVRMSDSVTNIGGYAFADCAALKTAVLSEKLVRLGEYAFNGCSALESVTPTQFNDLVYVGRSSLRGCTVLETGIAFGYATNALTGEMIETLVPTEYQFRDSPKLAFVRFGPGVKSLPASCFNNISPALCEFGCNLSDNLPRLYYISGNAHTLTNVIFRATGDITLSSMMLRDQTTLSEITWYGYPASYVISTATSATFYGWKDLQCRFIVPRTNDSWNAFMADPERMTPWASCDAADKAAYFARYGKNAVWPAGISVAVEGGLPRTYIVRTLEGANEAQLVAETSNGAMSSIALDPEPSSETGLYAADTPVTVTLTLREGASLVGWEGDVAEADRTKTSFVVTMDRSKTLFAKVCVQPEIADGSFAVAFPRGDSQAKVSFALTGVAGAVYDATAEILVRNGGEWSVWQTLTGLTNGQAVSTWVPTPLTPGTTAEFTVRVAAPNAAERTTGTPDPVDVPSTWPTTWGKGGGEGVCHVKADATGDGSGSDWFNALTAIPLTTSDLPAGRREIWIATNVVVGESAACKLSAPVSFRGGFVGLETSAEARPAGLKTVLDGEDVRETFTLTASGAAGAEYAFERLVFTRSLTRGLSFTAADANPILTAVDCDFIANGTNGTINGRGLYLRNGGDSSLSNCTFQGNVCRSCPNDSAGTGFGAYFEGNAKRVFIDNCQFLTNGYADVGYKVTDGAAFGLSAKVVTVRNCAFRGNRSSVYGGAGSVIRFTNSQVGGSAFTNCVFAGNELCGRGINRGQSPGSGGLVVVSLTGSSQKDQTVDFCNCTFAYNIAGNMDGGSCGLTASCGTIHAVNCIFFDNVSNTTGADLSARTANGVIKAEYCLFGGTNTTYVKSADGGTLTLGEGMVTGDPKFVTRRTAFLALATNVSADNLPQAGHYDPKFTEPFSPKLLAFDVHVRPGCRSPAVDAGDPAADWSNEPKPNGKRLNLGAYGNTSEAARSPGGTVLLVK